MTDSAEAADRLGRKRVSILTAVMVVFAVNQAYLTVTPPRRTVEFVGLAAWLVMATALLAVLRTGGMLLRSPEVRRLANDEVTRANRAEAMEAGFLAAILSAIVLSIVAAITATPVLIALRIVILLGLYVATIRFVQLEKRALG